jgi:hypothetical protein
MSKANQSARAVVEDALQSRDIPQLADNEIGRLLGVTGVTVGKYRRRMENRGEISPVSRRVSRRGSLVDVRRIGRSREV